MKHSLIRKAVSATSVAIALAACPAQLWATPDDKDAVAATTSFKDLYEGFTKGSPGEVSKLNAQADVEMEKKHYVEACVGYLAAASIPLNSGVFEPARPYLDKMYTAADKMPLTEQKQLLEILKDLDHDAQGEFADPAYLNYMAIHKLQLMQRQPGMTARDRYRQIENLAYSCSRNKRYGEAEANLLTSLKELKLVNPEPEEVGRCEKTLARVYNYADDAKSADLYYGLWTDFEKRHHNGEQILRSYEEHLQVLSGNKLFRKETLLAAEYWNVVHSHSEAQWASGYLFLIIAHDVSQVDMDLADKYYRAVYEKEVEETKTARNMSYGDAAAEWAAMLHEHAHDQAALAVLQDGMNVCRGVKWPDAIERNMPPMAKQYESCLRASNRIKEADTFHTSFDREMAAHKERVQREQELALLDEANKPSTQPWKKVQFLTQAGLEALDRKDCDHGNKLLQQAVSIFEDNAASEQNDQMYGSFFDVGRRLAACGLASESRPILIRIVKAHLIHGFADPATENQVYDGCATAFDELFNPNRVDPAGASEDVALLRQLLADAKSSGKRSSVICLLTRIKDYEKDWANKAAMSEEIQGLRADGNNNPGMDYATMMRTADELVAAKQFDKATAKYKAALALISHNKNALLLRGVTRSVGVSLLADSFVSKGDLSDGRDCYFAAYKLSIDEGSDYGVMITLGGMDYLAKKCQESNDQAAVESMWKHTLAIAKSEGGEDSTAARQMLLRLASFYARSGDKEKVKSTCTEFLSSLNKPGVSVSDATIKNMGETAGTLKRFFCDSEAETLTDQQKKEESKHCAAPSAAN